MCKGALSLLILIAVLMTRPPQTGAQTSPSASPAAARKPISHAVKPPSFDLRLKARRLDLDTTRFELDKQMEAQKFEFNKSLEMQKLQLERDKGWWSALGTGVPLLAAILTVLAGIASQYRQSRTQFEVKAASIAFSGKTPEAMLHRGQALKRMFPNRLPDSFLDGFDPQKFGGGKEPADLKRFILQLIAQNLDRRAEIVELVDHLFPGDSKWIERLKAIPPAATSKTPAAAASSTSGAQQAAPPTIP